MLDQLVAAKSFVIVISLVAASIIVRYRARDAYCRDGGVSPDVIRIGGFVVLLFGLTMAEGYEFLRWVLLGSGHPELSHWYLANAWLTIPFGIVVSGSVSVIGAAALWPVYRWNGAALAAAGLAVVWLSGFHAAGLI